VESVFDKCDFTAAGGSICFGEDLASWLRIKLIEKGIETGQPHPQDWGWGLAGNIGGDSYFLCVSGNSDGLSTRADEEEWGMVVEKQRSFWNALAARAKSPSTIKWFD
jgi:hypothetical protein